MSWKGDKMFRKILVLIILLSFEVIIAKDINVGESNSSLKLTKKGVDVVAGKLANIVRMSITEITVYGKKRANKRDLTTASMVLKMLVKYGQAQNTTPSDTPKLGSATKVELYDNKIDKNLCGWRIVYINRQKGIFYWLIILLLAKYYDTIKSYKTET